MYVATTVLQLLSITLYTCIIVIIVIVIIVIIIIIINNNIIIINNEVINVKAGALLLPEILAIFTYILMCLLGHITAHAQ